MEASMPRIYSPGQYLRGHAASPTVRNIVREKLSPIYVLHGEEPFFITEIVQTLLDTVVDEGFKDFNETVLYGRDTNVDEVLAAARRFPMMADRQLVLVKEAHDMRMWKRKDDMAKLAAYAERPRALHGPGFRPPPQKGRQPFEGGEDDVPPRHVVSDKVRDHKLPQWIAGYAESKGLKVDGRVSQLLAESQRNNLQKVANELTKLQILLPAGTQVTTDHVEQHIGISKDYNVFELQRALETRTSSGPTASSVLRGQPQERPLAMVVPVLHAYFARVLVYQTLQTARKAPRPRPCRCSPYAVRDYARAAGAFSPAKVERIFGYLRRRTKRPKDDPMPPQRTACSSERRCSRFCIDL